MITYQRILVVSSMLQSCRKAIQHGVSLAQKYGAELYVLHPIYNPFGLKGWSVGTLSLAKEYDRILQQSREKLSELVEEEKTNGVSITELIKEGEPIEEILRFIKEKEIDLVVLLAHEEGHLEHFIAGSNTDELIRKMPCSIVLIKSEPGSMPSGAEDLPL